MNAPHTSALLMTIHGRIGWTLALVAFVGCSPRPEGQPEIAPVSGTVTMDEKPLGGVTVVFESERGVLAFGKTDAQGHYTIFYVRSDKGAGLGKNMVRIFTPSMGPSRPSGKDSIPVIYNTESTLEAHVVKAGNVFDFALESKPSRK